MLERQEVQGGGYVYREVSKPIPEDYLITQTVTERNKHGKVVMKNGLAVYENKPIRQFIPAPKYPVPEK